MVARLCFLTLTLHGCACTTPQDTAGIPAFPGDWTPPTGFWTYDGPERVIVTETDTSRETGSYSVLDPQTGDWLALGEPAHSDNVAGCAGAWLLVINRYYGDNLQFVDPETGATVAQYSVGNGTNPQAAVFWGERVFVSLYQTDYLLVAQWDTGEEIGRVDLSPWTDDDGMAEASQLFVHDGLLWVTLQAWDQLRAWTLAGDGTLLGVDPESMDVVEEIPLGLPNPSGRWNLDGDMARVAAHGAYLDGDDLVLDGGLLEVDLASGTASTMELSEELAQANIYDAVIHGDDVWLSAFSSFYDSSYEAWSLEGPTQGDTLFEGYTPAWTWEDPADPSAGVWLARFGEGTVEHRSWPDGALIDSHESALFPAWLERCGAGR